MFTVNIYTPKEIADQIAARVKARRLELNLTQEGLAERSGLKFSTYRRFENTGEISLKGLLQVAFALDMLADFNQLFSRRIYQTFDDAFNTNPHPRKRGKKR